MEKRACFVSAGIAAAIVLVALVLLARAGRRPPDEARLLAIEERLGALAAAVER